MRLVVQWRGLLTLRFSTHLHKGLRAQRVQRRQNRHQCHAVDMTYDLTKRMLCQ